MRTQQGLTEIQRLEVSVTCEACGTRFTYQHELLGSTRSVYAPMRRSEAGDRLALQVGRLKAGDFSDLPPHECPHCGTLQSWMAEAARRRTGERGGCAVAAALALASAVGLALPGGPSLDLVTGIGVALAALAIGAWADRRIRRATNPPASTPGHGTPPEIRFL